MVNQLPKLRTRLPDLDGEESGTVVMVALLDNGDIFVRGRRYKCGEFTTDGIVDQLYEQGKLRSDEFTTYHQKACALLEGNIIPEAV